MAVELSSRRCPMGREWEVKRILLCRVLNDIQTRALPRRVGVQRSTLKLRRRGEGLNLNRTLTTVIAPIVRFDLLRNARTAVNEADASSGWPRRGVVAEFCNGQQGLVKSGLWGWNPGDESHNLPHSVKLKDRPVHIRDLPRSLHPNTPTSHLLELRPWPPLPHPKGPIISCKN